MLLKQNDSLMAAGYLQRALHMDPSNYITHYLLGQAYHFLGRAQEASSEFQKAEHMRFGSESVQVQ